MSSLLEQAFIDAKALKEAAIKDAQNKVLERYSTDIKEAVDFILEKDEDEEKLERDDELTPEIMGDESGLEGEIPSAISAGDEEVEINLDQLSDLVGSEMEDDGDTEEGPEDVSGAVKELKDTVVDLQDTVEDIKAMASEDAANSGDIEDIEDSEEEEISNPMEKTITETEDEDEEMDEEDFINTLDQYSQDDMEEKSTKDANVSIDMGSEDPEPHQWARNVAREKEDKERRRTIANLKEKNGELNEKLSKYKKAIKMIVEKIEEVNLKNARLLYKNKVLSSASLNERQKQRIVDAISKTGSVKEAKIIFETLQSAVVDGKNKKSPKSIHEVKSRKASPFVINANGKEKKSLEDIQNARMRKLAGLDR